jgi:uncharacterized protein YecE (DUF72 family)
MRAAVAISQRAATTLWIGTSGWVYRDWRGRFYPEKLPQRRWFAFYAERFPTVELNAPFYGLPSAATVERWRTEAPRGFRYAVKASRLITHVRRLRDAADPLATFIARVRPLGPTLGPLLFQLPPSLRRADALLAAFCALLPRDLAAAFEFRHPSWFDEAVYALLRERGVAFCVHDWHGMACPHVATASVAYYRFHGPTGGYHGRYGADGLRPWAARIAEMVGSVRDVYVYFNNDIGGAALDDAALLRQLLSAAVASGHAPPATIAGEY